MSTDELTRLRRAFEATFPTDKPRADCPPAERIWEGVRDELPPSQQREVIHHVAVCPLCTEAWRIAVELEGIPEGKADERRPAAARYGWRQGFIAMAAALIVALGLGLYIRQEESRVTPPVLREVPASEIQFLTDGPLSRDDCVLRWEGPSDVRYYRLRVILAAEPLKEPVAVARDLEATEYRIAPDALADLPPGARLQVHIEAVTPINGQNSAGVFYFEVK